MLYYMREIKIYDYYPAFFQFMFYWSILSTGKFHIYIIILKKFIQFFNLFINNLKIFKYNTFTLCHYSSKNFKIKALFPIKTWLVPIFKLGHLVFIFLIFPLKFQKNSNTFFCDWQNQVKKRVSVSPCYTQKNWMKKYRRDVAWKKAYNFDVCVCVVRYYTHTSAVSNNKAISIHRTALR